jgi:hypothetical protein
MTLPRTGREASTDGQKAFIVMERAWPQDWVERCGEALQPDLTFGFHLVLVAGDAVLMWA